jgi:hypothetical protein
MVIAVKSESRRHRVSISGIVQLANPNEARNRTDNSANNSTQTIDKVLKVEGAIVKLVKMPETLKQKLAMQALRYGSEWEMLPQRLDRTLSRGDGSFYFLDLPAGNYQLTAHLPNSGTRYGVVKSSVIKVTETQIKAHNAIASMTLNLPATGIIGKVTTSDNYPVMMAKIQVPSSHEFTFSDDRGNYQLRGLEVARNCIVNVSANGYVLASKTVRLMRGQVQTVDFQLSR